jgi:energy-coupling factor transporter ATP-binding protein EcfA2
MKSLTYKLKELIYPHNARPRENDIFLGWVRLRDVPNCIDDFYRLWFSRFLKRFSWLDWFGLRAEHLFARQRFISFAEFQETHSKNSPSVSDFQKPAFRLLKVNSMIEFERFRNKSPNTVDTYFNLMKNQNSTLFARFGEWDKAQLPEIERGKHTYIVGGTGSGKSEVIKRLAMEDILRGDSSVILIEPNGDLSEQIAKQKDLDKNRLVYFDFSYLPATPHLNPFEFLQNSENQLEVEKQMQVIRAALVQIFDGEGQPLTTQMQSILQPCLDIIAKQKGDLKDLQRFVLDGENEALLEIGKQDPKHRDFFSFKFSQNNLGISKSGIYQKLQFLLGLSAFSDLFCGKSTLDLVKAIEQKKIIIFNLSKGNLGNYASIFIGKMLIAVLQNLIFQRATIAEEKRTPTKIYIDEFQDYINESVKEMFVQGRKYKVSLTVASQIVGQGMTAEMTKLVLGNTNIKLVGLNGYESLRIMSKETSTEIEELQKLNVGRFFCRIGNAQGFIVHIPKDRLSMTTCIDEYEWQDVLKEQRRKYYVPRERADKPKPKTSEGDQEPTIVFKRKY